MARGGDGGVGCGGTAAGEEGEEKKERGGEWGSGLGRSEEEEHIWCSPEKSAGKERGFGSQPSSTKANPRDQVKSIATTIEADSCPIRRIGIRRIGSSQYAVSTRQNRTLMYEARKMTIPFPSRASVSVMPLLTYLNLGLGELAHTKLTVELADRTVKYPKGIAENVLVEVRLMGETLVLNRSLDPFLEDYIELNDLNEPFELRRNQGDDLMPTIEEGEVIEEFRTRDDELDVGIDDYPSYCDYDKKIHIDYFAVLENMDAYRDEGIGNVIFGEPFLREVRIKTKWFKGIITIYNDDDEVTYQMVRSHL
ncbi:hypothetical protein Tco_0399761, partial [Tanacetum coccineum]